MSWGIVISVAVLGGCMERSTPRYSYVEVTVGDGFTCANRINGRDAGFQCWGRDVAATHPPFEALGPGMIHMAGLHGCGMDRERGVVCWGEPNDPVVSVPSVLAADVLVSPTHACVLDVGTMPRCWGQPGANGPGGNAFVIAPGVGHTCMLEFASHMPICWGDNTMGQATPPATSLRELALGDGFSCGIPSVQSDPSEGSAVTCWGRSLSNMPPPTARFLRILAGPTYVCGVAAGSGLVTCWGDGPQSLLTPPPVAFYELALGRDHACGITDGEVSELVCWGDNTFGQLDVPDPN